MPSLRAILSALLMAGAAAGSTVPDWHGWGQTTAVFGLTLVGTLLIAEARQRYLLERQRFFLDDATSEALQDLLKHDPTARLNIMRVKGPDLFALRRLRWIARFDFVRRYPTPKPAKPDADGGLRLGLRDGVAGQALKTKDWVVGDVEGKVVQYPNSTSTLTDPHLGLTNQARRMVADLTLIYSYPIFGLERDSSTGEAQPMKTKVIGIVNVDSSSKGAAALYVKHGLHDKLIREALPTISAVASYVLG